jgi:hypothetical protein
VNRLWTALLLVLGVLAPRGLSWPTCACAAHGAAAEQPAGGCCGGEQEPAHDSGHCPCEHGSLDPATAVPTGSAEGQARGERAPDREGGWLLPAVGGWAGLGVPLGARRGSARVAAAVPGWARAQRHLELRV